MAAVVAVVARAHAVAAGRDRGPAAARLRSPSGRWLAVHASCLRARRVAWADAVVIEPAKSAQIAPIIVEAYCLTAREQQITQAVARGLSNPEIAATCPDEIVTGTAGFEEYWRLAPGLGSTRRSTRR